MTSYHTVRACCTVETVTVVNDHSEYSRARLYPRFAASFIDEAASSKDMLISSPRLEICSLAEAAATTPL